LLLLAGFEAMRDHRVAATSGDGARGHDDDGHRSVARHVLAHAADDGARQSVLAASSHHDDVSKLLVGYLQNAFARVLVCFAPHFVLELSLRASSLVIFLQATRLRVGLVNDFSSTLQQAVLCHFSRKRKADEALRGCV